MDVYDGRRRLLSAGSLYVDVDRDLRDIANGLNKDDDDVEELQWSLKPLRAEFKTKDTEILFKKYQSRLQHRFFTVLLMLNIIVNFLDSFWYFLSKTDNHFPFPAVLRISSLLVYMSFLTLTHHNEKWLRSKFARAIAAITVLMAMLHAEYGGFLFTLTGDQLTFKWKRSRPVYYLIICTEILLPFPSRIYSSVSTLVIVILEIIVTISWPKISDTSCKGLTPQDSHFDGFKEFYDAYKYIISDLLFYIFAALVAYYVTFLLEIVNRRAFLDHRRCVESKFKLNFEKDQQEQLLGSCLPKHLMDKVRSDIRTRFIQQYESQANKISFSRPFTELYVKKFKNVTILYADIVNSMLLTQSMESPKALVETLNGLFGRFDSRAEANNCLRIKLLGDCYYCVSGIPDYDLKHALNSINMGLDMIDIIRTIREENQVNVDMRIGVHTGMVLSGLLGLKKWQYDIWSIDSMKASQMEHDGKPGFVHVTKTTLDLVPEETKQTFHIQENHVIPGETTYLIRKSRHHLINGKYIKQNSRTENKNGEKFHYRSHARNSSLSSRSLRIGSVHFSRRRTVLEVGLGKYREMLNFANETLSKAIDKMPLNIKRQYNGSHPSIEINPYFLHFIPRKTSQTLNTSQFRHIHTLDLEKERLYFKEFDPLFPYYLYCSTAICIAIMIIRFLTLYDEKQGLSDIFWETEGSIVCYVSIAIIAFSLFITHFKKHRLNYFCRIVIWFMISSSFIIMVSWDMVHCPVSDTQEQRIEEYDKGNREHECLYKWSRYYTYSGVLAITSICMFIRINLWLKFCLSTFSLLVINFMTQHHKCSIFLHIDHFYEKQGNNELEFYTPRMAHMQYLFIVYLMFYVIDRQIEYISRLDFLWSTKLKRERREAQVTREVNQLLLKNILPIHVAQRYLFNSQDPAEQLYYEAYNSCAVMFAAIPNFFKFYSETELNDDGLQYLAILNEIICDFDRLLTLPQFRSKIEKIKTIGSTYMAASGLQPGRGSVDSIISSEEETENLIVLIRFAMSMMKSLERFNQNNQSGSNMNFKMRVGISLGPVIAGVVGAVKPQYDIWGDTVNVASRMDTNGIANKIHITKEVADILLNLKLFKPVCRGTMDIKGKGKLTTYLIDCDSDMVEELFGLI